ncbi:MAG: PilZ domain-containing protein [Candidatus Hydrogenedentes bacterium]|jgi:hypothetical protein|nr:PilZ domain-containing protein [Candidatus Hydrogenedentota bacterium]
MAMNLERRKELRHGIPMRVEVRLDSGVLLEGNTENISSTGLFFETERFLPLGLRVRVYLIPLCLGHQAVMCRGEVSRFDDLGFAIAFDASQTKRIETLLKQIEYSVTNGTVA